jgi:signal transduction histidine kinase
MIISIRKTVGATALIVALVLVSLLALGIRQYLLFQKHEQVTTYTEKIIFQFAIIREHVTEALLEKKYQRLSGVAGEMEELNVNLSSVLSSDYVADQYKINFASSFDISSIVLLLRKLESGAVEPENLRQLNREIRTLGERLMLFDRVLVNFAKRKLIGFQNFVIGSLALVLSAIIVILLIAQRQLLSPLGQLWQQSWEVSQDKRSQLSLRKKKGIVADLAVSFQQMQDSKNAIAVKLSKYQQVATAVNTAQLAISRSFDRQKLFDGICRALLENKDYCLVWIGLPEEDGKDVMPVAADGSTSMSRKECDSCMAVLLTEAEEKGMEFNPAAKVLQTAEPVVHKDILAKIPKGLLKGTPLMEGDAVCAALPVQRKGKIYAVLSIYAIGQDAFSERDMELLEGLAGEAGLALSALDEQDADRREKELNNKIMLATESVVVYMNPHGEILGANEFFEQLVGVKSQDLVSKKWRSFFTPADIEKSNDQKDADLLKQISRQKTVDLILRTDKTTKRLRCSFVPIMTEGGEIEKYGCVGREVAQDQVQDGGLTEVQCSRLAVLGELSAGIAHEISDLNNGIINYAQILFDNIRYQGHGQDEDDDRILDKIIDGGERIAAIVRPLILYGRESDTAGEFLPVTTVLADTVTLVDYYFSSEGISLQLEMEENLSGIPVQSQQMQKVFFDLLYNGRHALNKRYAGKDPNKKLLVSGRDIVEGDHHYLEFTFEDRGSGMDAEDVAKIFDSSYSTRKRENSGRNGLAASRKIVENHGGSLEMISSPGESTTVVLRFPLP